MSAIRNWLRPGTITPLFLVIGTTGLLIWVSALSLRSGRAVGSAETVELSEPTGMEVIAALRQTGVTPPVLAAAGVSSDDMPEVQAAARAWCNLHHADLSAAVASHRTARNSVARLTSIVQSGRATNQEIIDLGTAAATLSDAQSALDALLTDLRDEALTPLSVGERQTLLGFLGRDHWGLPVEFLSVDRTESEWVRLRSALAAERIANRKGQNMDHDLSAYLNAARAQASVVAAAANRDTNLPGVQAAFANVQGW